MFMMLGVFGGSGVAQQIVTRGFVAREQQLAWTLAIIAGCAVVMGTLGYLVQRFVSSRVEQWSLSWGPRGLSLVSSKRVVKWSVEGAQLAVTLGSYYGTGTEHSRVHLLTLCFTGPSGPLLVVGCDYALAPASVPDD